MKKFFYLLLIIPFASTSADVRILSTTSTRDSGLYDYLLPIFEKKYDIEMGLDEMIEKINEDDSLLDYEDKVYSNFCQLKDSFSES